MKLDSNYSINCDGNGVTLIFKEPRKKINKETKQEETYIFVDRWHYLSVPQALNKYKDLLLQPLDSLEAVLLKLAEVEHTIKNLK